MQLNWNPNLAQFKSDAKARIDREAEEMRLLFITPGSGQMMVYLTKEAEAKAYLNDETTDPALIPHVVEEASRTGLSRYEVATIIYFMAEQWRSISSRIEGERQRVKLAIDACASVKDVIAVARVDWPSIIASPVDQPQIEPEE